MAKTDDFKLIFQDTMLTKNRLNSCPKEAKRFERENFHSKVSLAVNLMRKKIVKNIFSSPAATTGTLTPYVYLHGEYSEFAYSPETREYVVTLRTNF